MPLHPIAPDPEPTPEDLKSFHAAEGAGPPAGALELAELLWRAAKLREDRNAFLVPVNPFDDFRYAAYLDTPLWKTIRAAVLVTAKHRCSCCSKRAGTVHHRDYRPRVMAGRDLTPLVAVCGSCHQKIHFAGPGKTNWRDSWNDCERALASMVESNELMLMSIVDKLSGSVSTWPMSDVNFTCATLHLDRQRKGQR